MSFTLHHSNNHLNHLEHCEFQYIFLWFNSISEYIKKLIEASGIMGELSQYILFYLIGVSVWKIEN